MVDNEPFAKGASKKLSVHIPAFFFLFGGRGGRQGNIKMRHRCEQACSPRGGGGGGTLFSNDRVD